MKLPMKLLGILAVLIMITMAAVPAGADTGKPSVAVSDVKITPAAFMPGDTGTITITIVNPTKGLTGDTTSDANTYNYGTGLSAQSTITHTETITTSSTNTPDGAVNLKEVTLLADSPVHVTSGNFADVGRLGAGDSATFTFMVRVDDNAASTNYKLTLKVRTDDGDVYMNYPISLKVDNTPIKAILNDAPQAFSLSKKTVVIDIVNARPNDVSGVSVIPSGGDFMFKPIQEYAVGTIGAGELYTVQFDVTAKNSSYSGNPSFQVVYMNGDNRHQTDALTVYTDHQSVVAASPGADNSMLLYLLGFIVLVGIVLVGIFVFLRGKRAKS